MIIELLRNIIIIIKMAKVCEPLLFEGTNWEF